MLPDVELSGKLNPARHTYLAAVAHLGGKYRLGCPITDATAKAFGARALDGRKPTAIFQIFPIFPSSITFFHLAISALM
jgi:hypothetical protein